MFLAIPMDTVVTPVEGFPELVPRSFRIREPFAYLDIETTGLCPSRCSITAVGILRRDRTGALLEQFFVSHPQEEAKVLVDVVGALRQLECVVSFNGLAFDLPFIRARARRSGLSVPRVHALDLLPMARRWRKRRGVPENCRLQTLARHFKIPRTDKASGTEVISAYKRWLETGDPEERRLILHHNADDLMALPELAAFLDAGSMQRASRVRSHMPRSRPGERVRT